jgi:hypothetical protein
MTYKRKNALVWSIKHNCVCSSCAKRGRPNSPEQKQKISVVKLNVKLLQKIEKLERTCKKCGGIYGHHTNDCERNRDNK